MNSKVKTILKVGILAVLVFSFCFYGLYRSESFLRGPLVSIKTPANGSTLSGEATDIVGQTNNVAAVFLNGKQIFTNEKGEFKENLLLAQGYNIIVVDAKDKFGRETKETREVFINN